MGSWIACLMRRPGLMVVEGIGLSALLPSFYRLVSRRATLLVLLTEPPRRIGLFERLILRIADGVLADGDAASLALAGPDSPARSVSRLGSSASLGRFLLIDAVRSPQQALRLLVVTDLTPESGAADLLATASAWSEAHPDMALELSWIGQGDLAGLLAAQPLPDNLSQTFLARIDIEQLAEAFADSGLLVIPSIENETCAPVAEALAAGLPVLGSRRSRAVRHLVTDGVNGWLFDPLTPGAMFQALSRALGTDLRRLHEMRVRARSSMTAPVSDKLPVRVPDEDAGLPPDLHVAAQQAR